jgi:acyl-CoA thioester hydrolase
MEIARLDLLKERGISFSQFSTYNVDATTYRIEVDYKKPVVYDDEIQIIVAVEELKKASLSFSYRILRGDCEVAAGRSMHAIVQSETSQPTRIPDAIRQILEDEPDQS